MNVASSGARVEKDYMGVELHHLKNQQQFTRSRRCSCRNRLANAFLGNSPFGVTTLHALSGRDASF